MNSHNKKVSMFGIILIAVSSVLVVDTISASAMIGPSAFVWWIIMFLLFFVPYGLVTAELGTSFPDEGGIVDWVRRAFGDKVGARIAWIYWVNYALWIPAAFYLFALIFTQIFSLDVSPWTIAGIAIFMSWVKCLITMQDIENTLWIPNIGSIFKSIIMLILGFCGIYKGFDLGFANEITFQNMMPSLEAGMNYLPIVIFNFMGFEVIAGASGVMKDPQKDIPKAVLLGGTMIAFFYVIATFGILATIPIEQISDSTGILESLVAIFGNSRLAQIFIIFIGCMFLYTIVSNLTTWAMGVNRAVVYAAHEGLLPKSLSTLNPKTGSPKTVALWNGIISTIVMVIYGIIAGKPVKACTTDSHHALAECTKQSSNEALFWDIFSLGAVTLLMSYILLFPAFFKLRKTLKDTHRPFLIPGGEPALYYCTFVPLIVLLMGILFFFYVPGVPFNKSYFINVGGGILITLIIGEIVIYKAQKENGGR
jgi:amino acid transporter